MADADTLSLAEVEEKYGPPPFDSTSSGDCTLRCSDEVLLKASRAVLCLASPVFKDMFGMPQGDRKSSDPEPIPIAESSTVFHPLLLNLYLSTMPKIKSCDEAFALLAAYDKYDIDITPLRPILTEFLHTPSFGARHETHYALAWVTGLKEEAQRAARHLHQTDIRSAKFKDDLLKQTGKDPQAYIALLELSLQRQIDMHAFIEKLPFNMYFCNLHSPSVAQVGQLRDLVNAEMCNSTPNAVRLLKSISQFFLESVQRPPGSSLFGTPTTPQFSGSRRTCSGPGCSTQVTLRTEAEIYDLIDLVEGAIQKFPQTIEWPKEKAAL